MRFEAYDMLKGLWILMKKWIAALAALTLALTAATAFAQATPSGSGYSGQVDYRQAISVKAPFGGNMEDYALRVGDAVTQGQALFSLTTTKVYAPVDGYVRGLAVQPGDDTADVLARYQALMNVEPQGRYLVYASTARAFKDSKNNNVNRYLNEGETVYLQSSDDDDRTGVGTIIAVDERNFTVEVKESNLNVEEMTSIYRDSAFTTEERLASYARVQKNPAAKITAEGVVLRVAVTEGQQVKRGDLLMETVAGERMANVPTDDAVLSPAEGVLISLPVAPGTTVQQDQVIATLYANHDLLVTFDLDEGDLDAVLPGSAVQVTLDSLPNREPLTGRVQSVSNLATGAGEAKYTAYVTLDSVENLRPGMSVSVYLQ